MIYVHVLIIEKIPTTTRNFFPIFISHFPRFLFCFWLKAGDTTAGDISQGCDPDTSQNMDDELDIINEDVVKRTANTEDGERSLLMAIDQAILKSIESCPTDEMKKKMYSSILIVGGGMKFRNAEKFLMQKLALQVSKVCRKIMTFKTIF